MNPAAIYRQHRVWIYRGIAAAVIVGLLAVLLQPSQPGTGNLPAFDQPDVDERKRAFFDYLRPIAAYQNERIREERAGLLDLAGEDSPGWFDKRRVRKLAAHYRIDMEDADYDETLKILLRRVDVVPESLVMVQAAQESAWGRSRFAREGNALFGEWCFTDGCGMVPGARVAGRNHEVQAFENVYEAVASYMRNLNTHSSYVNLRMARQRMRQKGEEPTGIGLAGYLAGYSERRGDYVQDIKSMIRQNDLEPG